MIEIYSMTWIFIIFFAIIGMIRGWNKEIIALAGIILATFALFQFDSLLRGVLLASVPFDQTFFVQVGLFGAIVYFAYHTRGPNVAQERGPRRNRFQDAILGGLRGRAVCPRGPARNRPRRRIPAQGFRAALRPRPGEQRPRPGKPPRQRRVPPNPAPSPLT